MVHEDNLNWVEKYLPEYALSKWSRQWKKTTKIRSKSSHLCWFMVQAGQCAGHPLRGQSAGVTRSHRVTAHWWEWSERVTVAGWIVFLLVDQYSRFFLHNIRRSFPFRTVSVWWRWRLYYGWNAHNPDKHADEHPTLDLHWEKYITLFSQGLV